MNQQRFLDDFEAFLETAAQAEPSEFEVREEARQTSGTVSPDGMLSDEGFGYRAKVLYARGQELGDVPKFPGGRRLTEAERRNAILAEIHNLYEAWVKELRWRFPEASAPGFPVLQCQETWAAWEAQTAPLRETAVEVVRDLSGYRGFSTTPWKLSSELKAALAKGSVWPPDVQAKCTAALESGQKFLAELEAEAWAKTAARDFEVRINREARCPRCGSTLVNRVCTYLTTEGEERPGHEYGLGERDPQKISDFFLDGEKVGEFWEADRNPVGLQGGDVFLVTLEWLRKGNNPSRWSPPT